MNEKRFEYNNKLKVYFSEHCLNYLFSPVGMIDVLYHAIREDEFKREYLKKEQQPLEMLRRVRIDEFFMDFALINIDMAVIDGNGGYLRATEIWDTFSSIEERRQKSDELAKILTDDLVLYFGIIDNNFYRWYHDDEDMK